MTITLNHTIVPARDKRAAVQFFARILRLHADPKAAISGRYVSTTRSRSFSMTSRSSRATTTRSTSAMPSSIPSSGRIREAKLAYGSAPWSLDDGKLNDWNGGRSVNVLAPFFLVQQLLPIPSKGSSIVFVSSLAARAAVGTIPAYAATKGAIDTMVKHFASLFGERYIRVNVWRHASSRLTCRSSPRRTWAGTSLWACRRSSVLPSPTTLAAWSPSSPLGTPGVLQALPSRRWWIEALKQLTWRGSRSRPNSMVRIDESSIRRGKIFGLVFPKTKEHSGSA
jgi:hypothetical protein